jgi:hypothetical protein
MICRACVWNAAAIMSLCTDTEAFQRFTCFLKAGLCNKMLDRQFKNLNNERRPILNNV